MMSMSLLGGPEGIVCSSPGYGAMTGMLCIVLLDMVDWSEFREACVWLWSRACCLRLGEECIADELGP